MRRQTLWAIGLLLLGGSASAEHATACAPRFEHGWIRLPASPQAMMVAGFGGFANDCSVSLEVVAVSSPAFADVSVHQTTLVAGVSRMRAVAALALPAAGRVELRPGGLHLMLMQPQRPLREGERLPLTFTLRDGRELHAELEVRKGTP